MEGQQKTTSFTVDLKIYHISLNTVFVHRVAPHVCGETAPVTGGVLMFSRGENNMFDKLTYPQLTKSIQDYSAQKKCSKSQNALKKGQSHGWNAVPWIVR